MKCDIYVLSVFKYDSVMALNKFKDEFSDYIDKVYKDAILLKDGRIIYAESFSNFTGIGLKYYRTIECDYFIDECYKEENKFLKNKIKELEQKYNLGGKDE